LVLDPACLQGNWRMEAEQINNKYQQLISIPPGSPLPQAQPGSFMQLSLQSNGTWSMNGTTTLRAEMPEGYMEGTANYAFSGTYTADSSSLTLSATTQDLNFETLRANINGQIVELPLTTNPFPAEIFSPAETAQYRCTNTELQISYTINGYSATETWLRSR
jgi:hypothetical protein